ncbi:hypothetical protein HDR60_04625, partial [bacterium]|nr:hypothetical protein [bacterium]
AKETRNLTRIKIDDVKQLIKDTQFVLDEFYYDKQIAYMPWVYSSGIVNPIEDVYKLIETIRFMIDKYEKGEWEKDNEFDENENRELYEVIFGLRQALHNSAGNAISNSQFKDKYMNWWDAYFVKNKEIIEFRNAEEKLKNKIEEEAGWVPKYSNGKIYYSYYTDYNGQRVSLDNIERDDEKEILNAKIVQERINRGY